MQSEQTRADSLGPSLRPAQRQPLPRQQLIIMKWSSLPSSCSFGSHFSFSEGTNKAHANLWQRRAVTSTQATPKCHLWVPTRSAQALLFSKRCFKPSHGGQQASEADSSNSGGGRRPITQSLSLSHGLCRLAGR